MMRGMFLVFNEPSDGNIEKKLDVSSQRCDVYPAHVYVPQMNKKAKSLYLLLCILDTLVHIASIGGRIFLKPDHYALYIFPGIMEVSFLVTFATKYIRFLHLQMIYLFAHTILSFIFLFANIVPNGKESLLVEFELPSLNSNTLIESVLAIFSFIRMLLVITYHQHVYYGELRQKFNQGKVIMQPQ
ncbi:uncharacterized protein CELE_K07A1.17 [Caenorhabditis elegans]|uniref:Uncharacterized protein n=1 Tax=Caenorhabditis elegans TaxID=6239 RepID=Q09EE6_CAEEL|nr:Uncharacterized protein CELE_K07A1.17 [Caenorhabditis elegans]CAL44976.1 Uncharacterized protein CELE_K07A1.17 [Caenorhabditis elegans]|eukprot:NP_001076605.1 Uncharacterized protein CELE_K07A1.17 [Caenorhabditis elegans]